MTARLCDTKMARADGSQQARAGGVARPAGCLTDRWDRVPAFVRGATCLNLSDEGAFGAPLRRIRRVWREHTRMFLQDVSGER